MVDGVRRALEANREAYEAQVRASEELTRQRDEYHASNDELWKRVAIAEQEVKRLSAELERVSKCTPFWRKPRAEKR